MNASLNPFSTRFIRPGAIPYEYSQDPIELIQKLATYGWRGEIVGPHGCGKSSLLRDLIPRLPKNCIEKTIHESDDVKETFSELKSRIGNMSMDDLLVLDGFEQFSRTQQFELFEATKSKNIGLLITCHLSTGLPTLINVKFDRIHFQNLVERLLEGFPVSLSKQEVDYAYDKYRPNIREALFSLYDVYESKRRRNEGP